MTLNKHDDIIQLFLLSEQTRGVSKIDVDVELLKEVIQNKGLKLQYVAKKLGLTGYGLNLKLSGKNDFKVSEANKLIEILNLSKDEIFSIFFTSYSHLK